MPDAADRATGRSARVAVTGAGGHLGGKLVTRLRDAGVEVVALRRDPAEVARWPALCADVDAVVHLAAPTDDVDAAEAAAALATTQRLFDVLPDRPVTFVFAGSMATFRPPLAAHAAIDERSAVWAPAELPTQDAYTRMKSEQERLVRVACGSRGDCLTILRPSNVWDDERWQQSCIGPKVGPLWIVVAPTRGVRLIHSDNCVRAFLDAVLAPHGGRTNVDATDVVAMNVDEMNVDEMNVDDGAPVSAWRYATRVARWRRHRYLPVPLPGWLFDAAASAAGWALRVAAPGRRVPGLLIAERRRTRFGGYRIDTRRVRERIGWRPDLRPYGGPPVAEGATP